MIVEMIMMIAFVQYAKKRGRVPSRENCMALCMSEKDFPCRYIIIIIIMIMKMTMMMVIQISILNAGGNKNLGHWTN